MTESKTFGIGEVSTITCVSQRKLRDWEGKNFIEPERIVCGDRSYRRYSKKDINLIKKIKELMDKGFTLKSAVQQMRLSKLGIPCLPIHDSYIVAADYEELLWQVMTEEYKNLLRYEPVIEKKN